MRSQRWAVFFKTSKLQNFRAYGNLFRVGANPFCEPVDLLREFLLSKVRLFAQVA